MEFEEINHTFLKREKYLLVWYGKKRQVYYHSHFKEHITVIDNGIYINYPTNKIKIYKPLFQQEKRQQAMERRAINLVLRRLIPYYEW